jgi:biotin carboxylase
MTGVFAAPAEEVRSELSQSSGVTSIAQRDELLAAVASVAAVGQRVFALRERMAAERYGDARYAEAQVFMGDVDALLGGQRRAVEGLARSLSGAIG